MSGEDRRQRFAYGQVENLIAAIHGAGVRPTALLGRFKHFQRLGFPGGSNTGRGSRAEYGVEQILAFALAFELLETGIMPVRAVRIVRSAWHDAARVFAITWAELSSRHSGDQMFLVLTPSALTELGASEDALAPSPDLLRPLSKQAVVRWLEDRSGAGTSSLLVFDPRRLVATVCRELSGLLEIEGEPPSLDHAFEEFGASLFGSVDERQWKLASGEHPADSILE